MSEEPKRLAPTPETTRALYLRSGNQCAFPGCVERIIDPEGNLVGEICHICAVKKGEPRFDEGQSNEDRRYYDNLILLCRKHHRVTDDEDKYPVPAMAKMKADHEGKFRDAVEKIRASVTDHTLSDAVAYPETMSAYFDLNGWPEEAEIREEAIAGMRRFADTIRDLPIDVREFLAVAVRRATETRLSFAPMSVLCQEADRASGVGAELVKGYVGILKKNDLAHIDRDDDDHLWRIYLHWWPTDWNVWGELQAFCKQKDRPLTDVLVDLRFDLLD